MQKKKKILKELQKVERQLQLKTQQQFTKEYMEAKGLKEDQEAGQSQGPGPGPGSTTSAPGPLSTPPGGHVPIGSDTDEEANKEGDQEQPPGEEGEEVKFSFTVAQPKTPPNQGCVVDFQFPCRPFSCHYQL